MEFFEFLAREPDFAFGLAFFAGLVGMVVIYFIFALISHFTPQKELQQGLEQTLEEVVATLNECQSRIERVESEINSDVKRNPEELKLPDYD